MTRKLNIDKGLQDLKTEHQPITHSAIAEKLLRRGKRRQKHTAKP
ncbi:MAG TPA: hypothetical protein PKN48_12490 [Bacteroidales bacterium]|nr:hypothetical protein [Bacteroidales bacterium]